MDMNQELELFSTEFSLELDVYDEETGCRSGMRVLTIKGESVLALSRKELNAKHDLIELNGKEYCYVTEIMGVPEGRGYYWEYLIDGQFSQESVDRYLLNGEEKNIEWRRYFWIGC